MSVFSPQPEFRTATAQERMGVALSEPFSFGEAVSENFQQGILDSFGLGTVTRQLATGGQTPVAASVPVIGPIIGGIFAARDLVAPDTSKTLTPEEYKASPYYRDQIPYDAGMTENRAAALASFLDAKNVRAHFSEKQPIAAFAGQFLGQALDPINYVPVFGEVARAAIIARAGSIAGRALIGASEAAINTAAFGVATAGIRQKFGDDVSWQAIGLEIGMSALIGGAFGAGIGVFARGADARARLDTAKTAQEALIPINESIDDIANGRDVALSPNGLAPVQRVSAETQATQAVPDTLVLPTMRDRFVAAGRPTEEADAAATLVSEFYRTTAARMGITTDQLVSQFGLPDVQQGGSTTDGALFQPAYHGTPHIFEKFDSSKIGTGEGAQAYGHGLYFAGKKAVAEWYRDQLAKRSVSFDGKRFEGGIRSDGGEVSRPDYALRQVEIFGGIDDAIKAMEIKNGPRLAKLHEEAIQWLRDNRGRIEVTQNPGRLFKVEVPDDSELMNWDAPLSEQPPKVKEALAKLGFADEDFKAKFDDLQARKAALASDRDPKTNRMREEAQWHRLSDEAQVALDNLRAVESGNKIYDALTKRLNDARSPNRKAAEIKASEVLREAGIPGHKYTGHESQSTNYVIYDDSRVNVLDYEQGGARGSIRFDDGKSLIQLFEGADASTALHESGHHFLTMFKSIAERADAPEAMRADWQAVKDWWGANADAVAADAPSTVTGADVRAVLETGTTGDKVKDLAINVGLQEQWARAFEGYLRDGIAPSAGLRGAFEQFKQWLSAIYKKALDLNVNISPEIRGVFDRLLAPEPARAIDPSGPKPEPIAEGLDTATARVGKPEALKELADQHGVDLVTGDYAESFDIDQMRAEGRLSKEDEAALAAADEQYAAAEAYGSALKAAMSCML